MSKKLDRNIGIIKKSISDAKQILNTEHLLKDYRDYEIIQKRIFTKNHPIIDRSFLSNEYLIKENLDNFTFKLIDNSIIYFEYLFSEKGSLKKSSVTYISGGFSDDDYNLMSDMVDISSALKECDGDPSNEFIQDKIVELFLSENSVNDNVINNIQKNKRNSIVIRIDADEDNVSDNHPLVHLTINNLENSRFYCDKKITMVDFIVFILDLIYGIKSQNFKKLIVGSIENF